MPITLIHKSELSQRQWTVLRFYFSGFSLLAVQSLKVNFKTFKDLCRGSYTTSWLMWFSAIFLKWQCTRKGKCRNWKSRREFKNGFCRHSSLYREASKIAPDLMETFLSSGDNVTTAYLIRSLEQEGQSVPFLGWKTIYKHDLKTFIST